MQCTESAVSRSALHTHQHLLHGVYGDPCLLGDGLLLVSDRGAHLDDGTQCLASICLLEEEPHFTLMAHYNRYTTWSGDNMQRERENKISGVFRFYMNFFVAIAKLYGVVFMNVTEFQPFSIPCLNYTIFHC